MFVQAPPFDHWSCTAATPDPPVSEAVAESVEHGYAGHLAVA